jgi:hypothetical protein
VLAAIFTAKTRSDDVNGTEIWAFSLLILTHPRLRNSITLTVVGLPYNKLNKHRDSSPTFELPPATPARREHYERLDVLVNAMFAFQHRRIPNFTS